MKILNYLSLILAIIGISATTWVFLSQPKTGYVELEKVFDAFEMKKELEADLLKIGKIKQEQIDSLKFAMESLQRNMKASGKQDDESIKKYKQDVYNITINQQKIEENIELLKQEYNDRIWKQLNQYQQDYGLENNFEYLFGASGAGSLMYANKGRNMTADVIKYVNKKYQGKK